jgi:hypothetical protein
MAQMLPTHRCGNFDAVENLQFPRHGNSSSLRSEGPQSLKGEPDCRVDRPRWRGLALLSEATMNDSPTVIHRIDANRFKLS